MRRPVGERPMPEESLDTRSAARPARAEFIGLVALLTSLTALSIDALLPALHDMGRAFGVDDTRDLQRVVTVFIAGMVLGELVFGPLSDAVGRKRAIVAGLSIYLIGTLVAMTGESVAQVLLGRAIQGVGVSGPKIATRALVRDRYAGAAMARVLSFVLCVAIGVPMVAPALGQVMLEAFGWRSVFAGYLVLAAVAIAWLVCRQPETLSPAHRIALDLPTIAANTRLIVADRRVMALVVAAGAVFGTLVLYLGSSQAIFGDVYGVTRRFPLYFASLSVAIGVAALANAALVRRFGTYPVSRRALVVMLALGLIFLAGSVAANGKPPLAFFMACCFGHFGCLGILFVNLNAMAMDPLGRTAGLGASLVASISSAVAVILAAFAGRLYDGSVLVLNVGFLVGGTIAFACVAYAGRSPMGVVRS